MQDFLSPPDKSSVPALDLDVLMARVRAEVEARKRQASADVVLSVSGAAANINAPATADALLALPDAEFIREAYQAIFGREPGEQELTELRDRLLTGRITRSHALRDLLKTEEARRRKSRIVGLRQSLVRDSFQRSLPGRWLAQAGHTIRTIYLLPMRIRQFLKRVDAIERRVAEATLRIDMLSQELVDAKEATQALERDFARAKQTADRREIRG